MVKRLANGTEMKTDRPTYGQTYVWTKWIDKDKPFKDQSTADKEQKIKNKSQTLSLSCLKNIYNEKTSAKLQTMHATGDCPAEKASLYDLFMTRESRRVRQVREMYQKTRVERKLVFKRKSLKPLGPNN